MATRDSPSPSEGFLSRIEPIGSLILLAQLVAIGLALIRRYAQDPQPVAIVVLALIGLLALVLLFYMYRFIWRPPAPEGSVLAWYIFLNYWLVLLIGSSVLFALFSLFGFLLAERVSAARVAFVVLWMAAVVAITVGAVRRMKILQGTETYATAEGRLAKAGFRVRVNDEDRGPMRLHHVVWIMGVAVGFVLIGLGTIAVAIIAWWANGFTGVLIAALLFGALFAAFPVWYVKGLLDALRGRAVPRKRERPKPAEAAVPEVVPERSVFPFRDKVRSQLFAFSLILFLLTLFSWALLFAWIETGGVVTLIAAIFLAEVVFATVFNAQDDLGKKMRRVKPRIDLEKPQIKAAQGGVIVLGYWFAYVLLFGGLATIAVVGQATGASFRLFGREIATIWGMLPWGWLVGSSLSLHHDKVARPYYARARYIPFPVRVTGPFAAVIGPISFWNVAETLARIVTLPFSLGRQAAPSMQAQHMTLADARAFADRRATERAGPDAYLCALASGDEGVALSDCRGPEWKFFYHASSTGRHLEVSVSARRVRARRVQGPPGGPPERLPEEWLDPSHAAAPVRAALAQMIEDFQEAAVSVGLYLPASHFPDMVLQEPPEERPCWGVTALDEDMEPIQDFFVDAQTFEVLKEAAV